MPIKKNLPKKAYNNWQDNPVLTSVSTTAMPIAEIEFPAITICGQGSIAEVRCHSERSYAHQLDRLQTVSSLRSPKM